MVKRVLTIASVVMGCLVLVGQVWGLGSRRRPQRLNLDAHMKIDPVLRMAREQERLPIRAQELRGLAVGKDGFLYVAADRVVLVYDARGRRTGKLSVGAPVYALAVVPEGLYLALQDHVQVWDVAAGKATAVWPKLAGRPYLTSIAVGEKDVYVADAGNRRVVRFDKAGKVQNHIGERDSVNGVPGCVVPSPYFDCALAGDGTVWLANPGRHQFENYTPEGKLLKRWGRAGAAIDKFSGCCNPSHFALVGDAFVTSEKGLVRIKVHGADGELKGVVAGPKEFKRRTLDLDLAIHPQGHLLVLDPMERCVRAYRFKEKDK
jgi:hypothetical protein